MVFTSDEVESLNEYQKQDYFPPTICRSEDRALLIATEWGWYCPQCGFTQGTAIKWQKNWGWKNRENFIMLGCKLPSARD